MQISSNDIIPGARSCPFILSEYSPFRPPQKTGVMVQKSVTEQIINWVLAARKALSQQVSLSIVLAMGMVILTTPATTVKPRLWLLGNSNSLARDLTLPWPLLLALAIKNTDLLCCLHRPMFHQWSLFGSVWFSSLSSMEVSFSPSVFRSWLYWRPVYSVKVLLFIFFPIFLHLWPNPKS